jgi:hypothetical protein
MNNCGALVAGFFSGHCTSAFIARHRACAHQASHDIDAIAHELENSVAHDTDRRESTPSTTLTRYFIGTNGELVLTKA